MKNKITKYFITFFITFFVVLVTSLLLYRFVFSDVFSDIFYLLNISLKNYHLTTASICIALFLTIINSFSIQKQDSGDEYGSASWSQIKDFNRVKDKNASMNFLLGKDVQLSSNGKKTMINNNIYVEGGSGSGKTRFFVKPNLLQMRCSYVFTDPKGTILPEIGNAFQENGYKIKYFNTIDFSKSMKYNPFSYIKEDRDILTLIDTIIANTSGAGEKPDFWVKAEKLLYQALVGYIMEKLPKKEQNINSLMQLINSIEVKEDDENFKCAVDIIFDELAEENPDSFAVENYKGYKQAAGKTAKSILISAQARLAPFKIKSVQDLLSEDELDLDKIGQEKTVLALMTDDKKPTFDFIIGMIFTQMNIALLDYADANGGKLPIPVEVYADELFNICQIPNFEKLIAVMRSRLLSYCPIAQNAAQSKARYKDNAQTLIGCCDTYVFLGSAETETCEKISKKIGKKTVFLTNDNQNFGERGSSSRSQQKISRDLMTPDEVSTMSNDECIIFVKGLRPYKGKKYPYEKHPNYKLTGDYDKKLIFKYWEYKNETSKNSIFDEKNDGNYETYSINLEDFQDELNSLEASAY